MAKKQSKCPNARRPLSSELSISEPEIAKISNDSSKILETGNAEKEELPVIPKYEAHKREKEIKLHKKAEFEKSQFHQKILKKKNFQKNNFEKLYFFGICKKRIQNNQYSYYFSRRGFICYNYR